MNPKETLLELEKAGKFNEAAQLAQRCALEFPDDPEYPVLHVSALVNMKKYQKAEKAVQQSLRRFPDSRQLLELHGLVLLRLKKVDAAETAFLKALDNASGTSSRELADLRCLLADALWEQHKRQQALDEWSKALEANPRCKEARERLEENTNEYGMPKAPSRMFDDLYKFQQIHAERYFKGHGTVAFTTVKEAESVMGIIGDAWNDQIAPRGKVLDSMSAAAKIELFSGITVDYTRHESAAPKHVKAPAQRSPKADKHAEFIKELDKAFSFLPTGNAILMPFATHALESAGLPKSRFDQIATGETPTDEEKETIRWGHDLVLMIMDACEAKGTPGEVESMMDAVAIGCEVLEPAVASDHVRAIRRAIEDIFSSIEPGSKKRKKRST
jgi:tetratricopeptide (TPR) repeat protein